MDLNDVANIIAVTAVLPLAGFIYFYATVPAPGKWYRRKYTKRWKATEIGRTLMYQKIAWLVFLLFVLFGIFTESYFLEDYIRMVMYSALVILFWRVLYTLRRLQKSIPTVPRTDESAEGPQSAAGSQTQTANIDIVTSDSAE